MVAVQLANAWGWGWPCQGAPKAAFRDAAVNSASLSFIEFSGRAVEWKNDYASLFGDLARSSFERIDYDVGQQSERTGALLKGHRGALA
ncbi:MAG TPA: hypothetical protein VK681_38245 [Reyranella sp.]|nr:hypothetical protein [Reyranella sp.]